jgi:glycosyltransferase involved in cell wall biosynthesis
MPSFNQARFLETALRSILLQGYPELELFVLDGGSTDGSVDIIRKYEPWLTYWVSEPDGGQSAAINRGLRLASGTFTTWINSDDMLCRDALTNHANRVGFDASAVCVGDCVYIDEHDNIDHVHRARVHTFEDLVRIRTVWRAPGNRGNIDQPAVIFPRELALQVGGVNVKNHRTMDYELWGRFFLAGAKFEYTHIPFGVFRVHDQQKTAQGWATTQSLVATAATLIAEAKDVPNSMRDELVADLYAHQREYWRGTGRLARLGLPHRLVLTLRDVYASIRRSAMSFDLIGNGGDG